MKTARRDQSCSDGISSLLAKPEGSHDSFLASLKSRTTFLRPGIAVARS
jgi:hypothetical protein